VCLAHPQLADEFRGDEEEDQQLPARRVTPTVDQTPDQSDAAGAQSVQPGVGPTKHIRRQRSDAVATLRCHVEVADHLVASEAAGVTRRPVQRHKRLQIVVERVGEYRLGDMGRAVDRIRLLRGLRVRPGLFEFSPRTTSRPAPSLIAGLIGALSRVPPSTYQPG
jgi:hypothetical protein